MDHFLWIIMLLMAVVWALWERFRSQRILRRLDHMLDDAIRGTFREQDFDESLLSSVESKLANYLASSKVSARSLQEEKNKIKTLITDISHQTKTPIANILLYTQLLEEQTGEPYAAALVAQAQKLQSLIDALVKTSRLEAGVLTLHPRPGPLGPVMEEAAAQFMPQAAEKGLALTVEPSEAKAVFDPKWTTEAVCNLIDNAVKYTPSGSVQVRAFSYEIFSRIDVEDTGPGISEADFNRLFHRFYRGGAAYDEEGVGIGLYLVRQIAEGQGGYVKVFSRPGRGAKFSLFLPNG